MQLQKELEMFVSSKPYQEKAREITLFEKKKKILPVSLLFIHVISSEFFHVVIWKSQLLYLEVLMYFPLPVLGFMFHCTKSWQSEFYTPKSGRGEKGSKIHYLLNVIIFI